MAVTDVADVTAALRGQTSASNATATNSIVRYVVDQWNSRIGLSGSPRVRAGRPARAPRSMNSAPTTTAVTP